MIRIVFIITGILLIDYLACNFSSGFIDLINMKQRDSVSLLELPTINKVFLCVLLIPALLSQLAAFFMFSAIYQDLKQLIKH